MQVNVFLIVISSAKVLKCINLTWNKMFKEHIQNPENYWQITHLLGTIYFKGETKLISATEQFNT